MPERKTRLDGLALGLLLACCVFWGFQQVLVKATIPELAPIFQASLRFVGATGLLWLWCRQRGIALFTRDGTLAVGLLAGVLFSLEFASIFASLLYTSASRATIFAYTAPFWVSLLLPLRVKSEHLNRSQWLGLVLAFAAVLLAFSDGLGSASPPRQWQGDLLALAGGMFWGLTTVVIRSSRLAHISAERLLFYQVSVSALVLPLLSLALGEAWVWSWSGFVWLSMTVQTAIGAFASYLAWMWMLGHYPATRISSFVFLTPLFALLFGAWWLGEPVTLNLLAALAMVAGGILLVNRRPGA
jgi:drug/metabolite transporter (DMT)-like permease